MKKMKIILLIFVAAILICTVTAAVFSGEKTKDEQKTEVTPEPLVIVTDKEQKGKVTIYMDGIVTYEYEGPIKVDKADGEYKIEVRTESCSCFEETEIR